MYLPVPQEAQVVGDAEDVSFSGVSAADEDLAVGDGGPEKGSVLVWAHVCPLRRGGHTRRRGIGFSGFGCTHADSALGASFGGGGGSSGRIQRQSGARQGSVYTGFEGVEEEV